ncbi:cobalamin adenosyltransferase [Brevibacillus ginsengisoli]|uniref:cobalamin adenosyltransferase n=1 Tax=Brevibacillus ginsengisoli TaxID=363854 RepID=UPI003CF4B92E
MSVITESEVRKRLRDNKMDVFEVPKGSIVTPSAKGFLLDQKIEIKYVDTVDTSSTKEPVKTDKVVKVEPIPEQPLKFQTVYGGMLAEKPEHMTHLYGNMLVFKDHKRIILRGRLDSLESNILDAQIMAQRLAMPKLIEDLEEILSFVRNLVRCEVLNEQVGEFFLQGMSAPDLRERSHHPKKYFGIEHFFPHYDMGEAVVVLNRLRTLTRETELVAYQAFREEFGAVDREDIIRALNRLSSLFWIMMFKVRTGLYK